MPQFVVSALSKEVLAGIKVRAAKRNVSMSAWAREALAAALIAPQAPVATPDPDPEDDPTAVEVEVHVDPRPRDEFDVPTPDVPYKGKCDICDRRDVILRAVPFGEGRDRRYLRIDAQCEQARWNQIPESYRRARREGRG